MLARVDREPFCFIAIDWKSHFFGDVARNTVAGTCCRVSQRFDFLMVLFLGSRMLPSHLKREGQVWPANNIPHQGSREDATACLHYGNECKHDMCGYGADEVVETVEAEMGAPAKGSAVEGITSGAWRALAEICGKTAEELYDPLCYIENAVTDTQVRRVTLPPLHISPRDILLDALATF